MADLSQLTMPPPAASPQRLQRELLESARQLSAEAAQFAQEWQGHWPDPALAADLDACVEAIRVLLDRLVAGLGRPEGPAETEVAGLIGALLGTPTEPGPLRLLQALTHYNQASASLEAQKLLSEVDVLRIQLNALRTQWQDYLSLLTQLHRASGPQPVLPPQTTDAFVVKPRRRRWGLSAPARRGLWETFTTFATLAGVLLVMVGIAYLAVTHQPPAEQSLATTPAPAITAPPAASAPASTDTPQLAPTDTPPAPPTSTTAPQQTATAPVASGQAQLTLNPAVLLVPCPGGGAGTLQLVNTGMQPLNWTARASSRSGGGPGVTLDVAQGQLEPQGSAFINVTALTQGAQGTISISYTGATSPTTVTYSVSC